MSLYDQLNFNVKAYYNPCCLGVDFLFFRDIGDRREIVLPLCPTVQVNMDRGTAIDPSLRVSDHAAQQMLQALWDAGLRPNDGAGSGAEAAALRNHIKFAETVADKLLTKVTK